MEQRPSEQASTGKAPPSESAPALPATRGTTEAAPTDFDGTFSIDQRATQPHRFGATQTGGRLEYSTGADLPQVEGYEILEVLGRGGMGVVYKARQNGLNRLVALKMVLAGAHAGADDLARFRTEGEAVARLHHPHIVQIYEVGVSDGCPFFSLEFVSGGSLASVLHGTPQPPLESAKLVMVLAGAMQYAHENGVVHRDLKPANILLASGGAVSGEGSTKTDAGASNTTPRSPLAHQCILGTPKIADFGLAKQTDDASDRTASGLILGTPGYMAPEQASGRVREIGPAADVYALGAILYEMLCGRPPFRGATLVETLDQVRSHEPVPPRQLEPSVPADLETICLKCLQKDPKKRYVSSLALSEDLGRFQAGEPITARAVGRLERGWRWCRRNPAVAGLLAAVAASLLLGTTVATLLAFRAKTSANEAIRIAADMARLAKEERNLRLQADLQAAHLLQQRGHALCEQGESVQGLLWLARSLERVSETQAAGPQGDWLGHANDLEHLIRMDLAICAREVHEFRRAFAHKGSVQAVAFSPNGRLVLAGGLGFGVRVWDVVTGEPLGELIPHPGDVHAVAFSSDGKTILTAGQREARLWNLATRQPLGSPLRLPSPIASAALHPDGKTILVGRADGQAQLWDGLTAQFLGALGATESVAPVYSVAFTRDGTGCATGWGGAKGARCWNTATRQPAGPVLRGGDINSLAFRVGDNALLLASAPVGAADALIQLWNPVSGKQLRPPLSNRGVIRCVTVSPDGRLALATDDAQTAQLWDLETGLPRGGALRHSGRVYTAAFSPDGESFVTGEEDGTVRLWRVALGRIRGGPLHAPGEVWTACYSNDGNTVVAGYRNGWDDGSIYVWDATTGKLRWRTTSIKQVLALAWSPDGGRLLAGDGIVAGFVRQLNPWTGEEVGPKLASGPVKDLAWSPDGKTILTGSGDRTARLWDAVTGEPVGEALVHPLGVWSAVFSPDGTLVLTGGSDRQARVWDVGSGRLIGRTMPHAAEIRTVAFSPDGQLILTGCRDGFSRLWDFRTRRPLGPPLPQHGIIEKVAFGPDGQTFLTAGREGTVRQWTLASPVTAAAGLVRAWVETITGLVFDDNEAVQVLNSEEWRGARPRVPHARSEVIPVGVGARDDEPP